MRREVDFVDYYLPSFMQDYKEPVATLDAEQPEFQLVWEATDRVLYNHFISTADEYGISRFEKILGIFPASEDTLESRRSRVSSQWFAALPYTWKMLLKKLTALCGENNFVITKPAGGYKIDADVKFELFGQVDELERVLDDMIPCNIIVETKNEISGNISGNFHMHGGIAFAQDIYITSKEEP
ncbi:MAG: YmfQ family protein [Lachnoclostridium sp.]|nr:YmfQ family protein [Lachnoclostridium sp.]